MSNQIYVSMKFIWFYVSHFQLAKKLFIKLLTKEKYELEINMKRYEGALLIIISAIGYGLMPLFASWATVGKTSVEMMLFGRFFVAFIILSFYLIASKQTIKISFLQFLHLFFIGGIGLVATTQMLFYSYRMIPVSQATALHFIYPVAVAFYAVFLKIEKITFNKVVALLLGVLGVWLLVGSKNTMEINILGITLAVLSGFTYAIYVVGVALPRLMGLSRVVISFYTSLVAFSCYFFIAIFRSQIQLGINLSSASGILGLAAISTVLSQLFFIKGVKITGPFYASILSTFEPLTGILVGLILFSESLTWTNYLGIILILLSLFLVVLGREINRDNG